VTKDVSRRALLPLAIAGASVWSPGALGQTPSSIHLRSVGEGTRAWVLIHPFGASGQFWQARAAALAAEHSVRVISPDLPSHGRSQIVAHFDYAGASRALEQALASAGDIDLVVGASSGGIAALKLAATMACPVAAIGVGSAFSARNIAEMTSQSVELTPQTGAFIDLFVEQGPAQRQVLQHHMGDLAGLGQAPLVDQSEAQALEGRALIINGDADEFFSPEAAHALARSIPRGALMFLTGAGHLDPLMALHRPLTWGAIAAFARAQRGG
jgi:pimeloyl-ACP methyl ester carboxylesterase